MKPPHAPGQTPCDMPPRRHRPRRHMQEKKKKEEEKPAPNMTRRRNRQNNSTDKAALSSHTPDRPCVGVNSAQDRHRQMSYVWMRNRPDRGRRSRRERRSQMQTDASFPQRRQW